MSQAAYRPLTGLLNRRGLQDVWARCLSDARVNGYGVTMLYLDLNCMKSVNDQWGHAVGDVVLTATADRLQHRVRAGKRLNCAPLAGQTSADIGPIQTQST